MTSVATSPSPSPRSFATSRSPALSATISRRSTSKSPSTASSSSFAPRSVPSASPRHAPSATPRLHHHIIATAPPSVPVVTTPLTSYKDSGTQYTPCGFPPTARKHLAARSVGEEAAKKSLHVEMQHAPCPEPQRSDRQAGRAENTAQLHVKEEELAFRSPEKSRSDTSLSSIVATLPSSPKQSRHRQRANPMPKDYMQCNPLELGVVIADMLVELIHINDEVPPTAGILTRFHSRAPPTISVRDYLDRLIFHATLSPPLLLAVVFYIDRLCLLYPAFTINSLTVHRFLITAATVAAKGLSDSFWTNHTYARVGGVSTKELAMLELEFLDRLDWNIVPKAETLDDYYRSLVTRDDEFTLEGDEDKEEVKKVEKLADKSSEEAEAKKEDKPDEGQQSDVQKAF